MTREREREREIGGDITGTRKYCSGLGHMSSLMTSAMSSHDGSPVSPNHVKKDLVDDEDWDEDDEVMFALLFR